MKGAPLSIHLFRFLVVLAIVVVCVTLPIRVQTVLLAVALGVGLWLFCSLCVDAKAIRKALEELDRRELPIQPFQSPLANPSRVGTPSLVEGLSTRQLGDRVFKADESKTCKSCQSFEPEGPLCLLDNESLAGITITAVGCQRWSPGLKVAERPDNEEP